MASTRKRLEALTAGLSIPDAVFPPAAPPNAAPPAPPINPLGSPRAGGGVVEERVAAQVQLETPPHDSPGATVQGVETRFPPAQIAQPIPRTGPGQMLAFRGQMQAVEGELSSLRERLKHYDGSTPTRKIDPRTVRPTRWANRHSAAFENAEFAGLKADIEQAGGNVQPILVRPIAPARPDSGAANPLSNSPFGGTAGDPLSSMSNQGVGNLPTAVPILYELVFGHRRHRACLELGIPVLASIWVDELGDAELFAAMDRENRERADLSPFEQGVMYQRALEEQLFPTQRQLAEKLGVSHTWVRKALMVAQLPSAVVECFRSPLEIQHRHAEQLNAGLDKDRRGVLKRAEKLRGLKLPPAVVAARLLGIEPSAKAEKLPILLDGRSIGSCVRAADGSATLSLSANAMVSVEAATLARVIDEVLGKLKALG